MEDVTSPTGKPRRRPAKSAPAAEAVAADEPAAPKKRTRAAKAGTTVVTAQANNGTSGTPDRPAKAPRKRQPKKQEPDDLITELDRVLADLDPTPAPDEEDRAKAPLWAMIVADPGFTSEHVAREAVRRVGADARDWVAWVRGRYPGAGADAIARLAAQHYATIARRHGAGTAAAGLAGSVAGVGDLARIQARLVLTVAAA